MSREVEVPIEVARAVIAREDSRADRWGITAFVGFVAGIVGTSVTLSNHPAPTWSVVAAALGWLTFIGSFAIAIGASYADRRRVMNHYDNGIQDYDDWSDEDFDDEDDELDEEDMSFLHRVTDPAPNVPAPSAPSAGGGSLLSSLRQQQG